MNNTKYLSYALFATALLGIAPQTLSMEPNCMLLQSPEKKRQLKLEQPTLEQPTAECERDILNMQIKNMQAKLWWLEEREKFQPELEPGLEPGLEKVLDHYRMKAYCRAKIRECEQKLRQEGQ